jgi:hypothetical protein
MVYQVLVSIVTQQLRVYTYRVHKLVREALVQTVTHERVVGRRPPRVNALRVGEDVGLRIVSQKRYPH